MSDITSIDPRRVAIAGEERGRSSSQRPMPFALPLYYSKNGWSPFQRWTGGDAWR